MRRAQRVEESFRIDAPQAGDLGHLALVPERPEIAWSPPTPDVAGGGPGPHVLAERLQGELWALGDPTVRVEAAPGFDGAGWRPTTVTIDLSTKAAAALHRRLRWERWVRVLIAVVSRRKGHGQL